MIPANSRCIPIPRNDNDVEFRICNFHAGGKCNSPAMGRVQGIKIQIPRGPAGAPDAGNNDDIIFIQIHPINRAEHGFEHDAVAAARTPDEREFIFS